MSAEESVALYDPDDVVGRVVGAATRARVRAENLPHAATAVLVRRSDGRLLVHRRSEAKDLWPGAHDAAGGGVVLAGESPDEAARRELAEEVGIDGTTLRPLLTSWYRDQDAHYLAHVYEAVWDGGITVGNGEVAAAWWQPESELRARLAEPDWPFVPDTRRLLGLLAEPEPDPGPWPAGALVVFRFGRLGRTSFARLGTVLEDGPGGLLLWISHGSPTVRQVLADGRDLRQAPLDRRGSDPRVRRMGSWWGHGMSLHVPPEPNGWSVWSFFDDDGVFQGWYGNLEAPQVRRRTALGTYLVDTADRALDVWVPLVEGRPAPQWKDEDEFAAFTGLAGRWSAAQAVSIRADGERLFALAAAGRPPFDGRRTTPPNPLPPAPSFPADWDLPHVAGP
jgi:8-oxo-dGTP pyrophosphatase MutT (NUDIX family)